MNTTINVNSVSNEDVDVSEYTIDNPKLVEDFFSFEGRITFTGVVKDVNGIIAHYVDGILHRNNGPSIEYSNGRKEWLFYGIVHRDNGPAIEHQNGSKFWLISGKLHRKDGAAIEYADGCKEWWFNGEHYGSNAAFTNESWVAHLATLK